MAISDLIEQTIAQHITQPKVLSYAPTKLDEVQGRFVASNRVYNFVLNKKGISYSPAGQGDSLLFSALYLRQDAVRKPKIGNDKCNAGRSYQCGKICLGNRRKCHKGVRDVNDARRIASILESTNRKLESDVAGDVSDKAIARGRALFEARKGRVEKPKGERRKSTPTSNQPLTKTKKQSTKQSKTSNVVNSTTSNDPSKPKPTKAKPKINVQLMDTFVDEIKLKDGEAKPPQKNIDEAARLLKELGGRVSIPLMTEEKSGKVIGNSLLYHAAKKAGIERLWTVQGKDVDPDIEERLEKLNTDHGKSSSVSDAIQNGTTRKNQLMQDVRNYEIVQDDVKYPTKALDEAAKLLKEQGTNISPIILMEFGEGKTTFNGREVKHPQYKVIGNSFIYEAAKRAGMGEDEGIWNIKVNNKKDAELVQRLLELTKNN
jgi:hypothetical protein